MRSISECCAATLGRVKERALATIKISSHPSGPGATEVLAYSGRKHLAHARQDEHTQLEIDAEIANLQKGSLVSVQVTTYQLIELTRRCLEHRLP